MDSARILTIEGSHGKSIMSNEKCCYVCGQTQNIHKHHIFGGTGNRMRSEYFGCWVPLCAYHHNFSNEGVHFNRKLDLRLKQECQERWEENYGTREEFRTVFGKSWL